MERRIQILHGDVPGFELRCTELVISGTPSLEQWKAVGQQLIRVSRSARWALGDLINFAKAHRDWGNKYADVLDEFGLEPGYVRQLSMTAAAFPPARRESRLPWSHYRDLAAFPADVQDRLLTLAEQQHWGSAELRAHARSIRHEARKATREWPSGQYGLIYCDPPWQTASGDPSSRAPEQHYPTMPLEEIIALAPKIKALATPDAILYLWATSPKLREALAVIEAWGFDYKTSMVWVKDLMGMGCWARQRHELLLIAVRGHPVPPDENDRPDSVILAPRREHSEKPGEVAELLHRLYPGVPKVELFARQGRPGWDSWGNQALGDGQDLPLD